VEVGSAQRLVRTPGPGTPINDTWIAACCLIAGLPLATRNLKDFTDFAEHDGLRMIGVS